MKNRKAGVASAGRLKICQWLIALALGAALPAGQAWGFFPAAPVPRGNGGPNGTNQNASGNVPQPSPPGGSVTPPGGPPPGGPQPPPDVPAIPNLPPPPPPGTEVPEMDPAGLAGALGIFFSGALMLIERRRRR